MTVPVQRAAPDLYRRMLAALLPPGAAWPRDPDSNMGRLLDAAAQELARVHNRQVDLVEEDDPRTASELLGAWETEVGLPDLCTGAEGATVQERRQAVHAKLTSRGGQSRAYFIALARSLGYEVTIKEFRPLRAGFKAGAPCCDTPWQFVWRVQAPAATVRRFTAGSKAGEPLAAWGNKTLECACRRRAPAHTLVQFGYGG
jgi:uncharacterized protein YmfQ (DUF2313 family)